MMTQQDTQLAMFGCTYAQLDEMIADYIGPLEMLSMSILSDAQEVLERGRSNESRQYMNRAKYVMSVIIERNMEAMRGAA